jgi:hypothetical protein
MTGPIDPIRASRPIARQPRHDSDADDVQPAEEPQTPPAVIAVAPTPPPAAKALAAFAAQMLAGAQRRGLRGGPGTLENAKAAYMGAEWSGDGDRRTRPGRITKTEI